MNRRRAAALLAAVMAMAGGCAPTAADLSGRVVHDGVPVAGARVTLLSTAGQPRDAVTGADGVYRFDRASPGSHILRAHSAAGGGFVPAWGDVEVELAPGERAWEGIQLVPREGTDAVPHAPATPGFGAVSGRALLAGEPVAGAVATLYVDRQEGLKGLGFRQSAPTGADGRFAIEDVPAASYHLAVRKRRGGTAGPVLEGDAYGVAAANPIVVRADAETRVTVHLARKEKDRPPYRSTLARTGTAVAGRVTDDGGRPLAGLYVFAYRDRVIGHRMPDFLSSVTGPDGVFLLPLGEGGLFYVGAREQFGGSPRPGERFGLYEGSADHGLRVPRGERLEGVEIRVREVLPQ